MTDDVAKAANKLKCKACRQDNHTYYDKRYGGYCLDCANAGAPEKDEEIARLTAALTAEPAPVDVETLAKELRDVYTRMNRNDDPSHSENVIAWLAVARRAIALAAGPRWQPIETAPKDGSSILAVHWLWKAAKVVFFNADVWRLTESLFAVGIDPTHWQPLPTGPIPSPPETTT